jgi:NAD(P)-dependent dehydrogenase (short-subunit alcohol dehydrogenase family)
MTMEQWGRADVLVHSAGNASVVPIDRTDEDLLYRTFSVNTFAAAYLIARLWPIFRRQRGGCIVNVSTMGTSDPFPGFFAYAAAKSALESLTRSAAKEGAAFGVRAFAVAPGAVETDMLRASFSERQIPPQHTLDPLDVAHVICDCVLGRRDGEAGTTIYVPSP